MLHPVRVKQRKFLKNILLSNFIRDESGRTLKSSSPSHNSEGLSNPEEVKGGWKPTFIHLTNHSEAQEGGLMLKNDRFFLNNSFQSLTKAVLTISHWRTFSTNVTAAFAGLVEGRVTEGMPGTGARWW